MTTPYKQPTPFLTVVVHDTSSQPTLCALCAAYEQGVWRSDAFARHLLEWLPEFALTWSEYTDFGPHNAAEMMNKAAQMIYTTEKYAHRGEFGELLLHVAMRFVHDTIPAITKIFFKDGTNETVKGFDAVHVIATDNALQLWLGEVKFYKDLQDGIRKVATEIHDHVRAGYFRRECAAIVNKIDPEWPHADKLRKLLHRNTPLDTIFDELCIPVLLTYESNALLSTEDCCDQCCDMMAQEAATGHSAFATAIGDLPLSVHLFLVPLESKSQLVTDLNKRLRTWQSI